MAKFTDAEAARRLRDRFARAFAQSFDKMDPTARELMSFMIRCLDDVAKEDVAEWRDKSGAGPCCMAAAHGQACGCTA